ncbi:hypothetical protein BG006_004644 [Podila minutissima]|uniref:Membrane-associated protein n=1 Tax=Podila minutissima TaxID=64525 RepID=A0A9P5VM82_9FUNG|nr:hypothetical protein BG006_004644 [Podila minutissima]
MSNAVLVSAVIVSFSPLFVSSILTAMVSCTDLEGSPIAARAFTTQLISMDLSFWIAYLKSESTVEETLTAMLNDTRRNLNPNPRTRYTPRTFAHEDGCGESNAIITMNLTYGIHFPSTTINCEGYIMLPTGATFDWEPMAASFRTIDSSTAMAVAPAAKGNGAPIVEAIEPFFFAIGSDRLCTRVTSREVQRGMSIDFPKDGMMALPKTHATKCQYGTDGSLVSSVTYFKFAVSRMKDLDNITASILDDPTSLPLLKPMNAAIHEGVFVSPTNNSTLPESIADQLYILYDAVELKDAYEVSTAAFAVVCVFTGLFRLIWAFSETFFPTVYNITLYKTIYKGLNSKDESVPMLMHCTHDPLAFDGNQVGLHPDDQPSVAPETSSQDHPMVSLQRHNNVPNQQQERQSLMLLDGIPTQSPLMSSWPITAATPIMSPTTARTTATPGTTTSTSRPIQATQLQPFGSTNLDVPPSIHPRCVWFAHGTSSTSLVQARLHGATTHGGDQTSDFSTRQGPTLIQSPFE